MNCATARDALVDRLAGALADDRERALEHHLESCAACRAEARVHDALWSDLGRIPAAEMGAESAARVRLALAAAASAPQAVQRVAGSRMRVSALVVAGGALAAGLMLGFLAGRSLPGQAPPPEAPAASSPIAADAPPPDAPLFLLLLLDPPNSAAGPERIAEYAAWGRSLRARGRLVVAEKLADEPSTWLPSPPAQEACLAERVSGFFLLRAHDYDDALSLARESPHAKYGGRMELRSIDET